MMIFVTAGLRRSLVRSLLVIQWTTLCAGTGLVAWPVFVTLESEFTQWSGRRQLSRVSGTPQEQIIVPDRRAVAPPARTPRGAVVGRFVLPRLKLSYVVLSGTDSRTLDKSIGLIEGTSSIGEAGNVGIAGHRNTHFRKLEWVRRDDEIILSNPGGEYRYRVEWIRLFRPGDVAVLDHSHGPALTLITCFPFEYVGAAPLRFVVRALPDESTRTRLLAMPQSKRVSAESVHD